MDTALLTRIAAALDRLAPPPPPAPHLLAAAAASAAAAAAATAFALSLLMMLPVPLPRVLMAAPEGLLLGIKAPALGPGMSSARGPMLGIAVCVATGCWKKVRGRRPA